MRNPYYNGPVSEHFDGKRFYVPGIPSTDKSLGEILKWRLQGSRSPWPKAVPALNGVRPEQRVESLTVTHIGHASLLLQAGNYNILVDPVWSKRASPFRWFGPRRHNAPSVQMDDLPPIDAVLITHNHYDHLDLPTLRELSKRHNPRVLTPLGNDTLLRKAIKGVQVVAGDWWSRHEVLPHLEVTIVPAYHWSSRFGRDTRMALWGGFVLRVGSATVYCAGDTAHADAAIFRDIASRFPQIDLALLPIGAYEPRWFMQAQHADPNEALDIAGCLRARAALGIHWGTFQLTDEPWEEPALRFADGARQRGWDDRRFLPLRAGQLWCASALASPGNSAS